MAHGLDDSSALVLCEGERDHEQRRCCEGPDVRRVEYMPRPGEYVSGPIGAEWCAWCREMALASGVTFLSIEPIRA